MTHAYDLIVLGAGPAGAAATVKASGLGLAVAVIDEAPAAGGQVYRAPSPALNPIKADRDCAKGDALRAKLKASGATHFGGHRVWSVTPGFSVRSIGPDGPLTVEAPNLISAVGALERHIPIPGWTVPGVIGLAAATVLMKAHGVLPGRRVVVAGSGPLLMLVASKILAAGGEVAALVDAAPRSAWLATVPTLLRRPDLASKGLLWALQLLQARVPIYFGSALRAIHGADSVTSVDVVRLDKAWRPVGRTIATIAADSVCLGFGLKPNTDVTRLLDAMHVYRPGLGGWIPVVGADLETSVPGLFVAGDGGGVSGADAAPISGELAAIGVARRFAKDVGAGEAKSLAARWRKSAAFGAAMSALAMPPVGAVALIASEATVCRCEGLSRATLDLAIETGSASLDALKAVTRCGMGPCGGSVCGEAAAMLVAAKTGFDRAIIGQATARPPLRPVPLSMIAGEFDYDDLPIPAPAPL